MNITMPRGDIRPVSFTINDANGTPSDISFDEIYFTVKRSFTDKRFLFQKKLSTGEIEQTNTGEYSLIIEPEDTNNLYFGEYAFDIEVVNTDVKQTFVGELILTEEATHAANEV